MLSRILGFYDKVRDYVTIGLLVGCVTATVLWRLSAADLALEKEGRAGDRKEYVGAQAAAEAKALRLKNEQEKKDHERQVKADAVAADLRGKYDGILRQYREAQRKVSRPDLSRPGTTPESSDRPGEGTVLSEDSLLIPYKDAEICAENTARLEAVQKWATEGR